MNKAQDYFLKAKQNGELVKCQKFGRVFVNYEPVGTEIHTIIDGKIETKNTVKHEDDAVITGPKGEKYIISAQTLKDRYKKVGDSPKGEVYAPTGKILAVKYVGPSFSFPAPWGENMICNNGDYLCATLEKPSEVYRIEKGAFFQTYKKA